MLHAFSRSGAIFTGSEPFVKIWSETNLLLQHNSHEKLSYWKHDYSSSLVFPCFFSFLTPLGNRTGIISMWKSADSVNNVVRRNWKPNSKLLLRLMWSTTAKSPASQLFIHDQMRNRFDHRWIPCSIHWITNTLLSLTSQLMKHERSAKKICINSCKKNNLAEAWMSISTIKINSRSIFSSPPAE